MAKKEVDVLSEQFIIELFKSCFDKKNIFEIVNQYLKFSFLQDEAQKKFWKTANQKYVLDNKIPTLGTLQLEFRNDEAVMDLITDIKSTTVDDHDTILNSFGDFLKQLKFLELNEKVVENYNKGDRDKSYALLVKGVEELSSFSIKDKYFDKVFAGFNERQVERMMEDRKGIFKIPTGIDSIDFMLGGNNGGPEIGESVLWLGDSGVGKSQLLIQIGIHGARCGHRVAHFQAEGTKKQCLNRYDAAWSGTLYHDIKNGIMATGKFKALQKIVQKLSRSDIYVEAFEKFGSKSLVDVRNSLQEMNRSYGKIDLVILDYLELIEVGDGIKYNAGDERHRQRKIAKGLKELAMEFQCVVHTATQASSVPPESKNDPDWTFSRYNLSEDKGKIQPFDIFFTLNQTNDEREDSIMRLYADKLREYKAGEVVTIANSYKNARFYDRKRTMELIRFKDQEDEED